MLAPGRPVLASAPARSFNGLVGLLLTTFLVGLALPGCINTPTLPLPPPVAKVGVPDEQGFALVEGDAEADAYVSVLNENSDEGVITKANDLGEYSVKIKAESDDHLVIWQTVGGETGELKRIDVPRPR